MADFFILLSTWLDKFINQTGKWVAWLALFLVLTMFSIVVIRYVFEIHWIADLNLSLVTFLKSNFIPIQESVIYFHAMLFLTGIAYALQHEEHVRVDIFYQKFSAKIQAWVDLFGTLFLLLPVSIFIIWVSTDYITSSFQMKEASQEAGGLPWVYWLKGMIYVMSGLLILQALSNLIKIISFLSGKLPAYKITDTESGAPHG